MAGKHAAPSHAAPTRERSVEQTGRAAGTKASSPARGGTAPKRRRRSGRLLWAIPVVAVLILGVAALGGTMVYASRISSRDTIYPNISVNGVDVGGLTVAQAADKLADEGADPYRGASVTVVLPLDHSFTVTAAELGLGSDVTVPAEAAYAYGRSGSAIENLRAYRACQKEPVALAWEVEAQIDEQALHDAVAQAAGEVNKALLGADAEIGDEGITLVKGTNTAKVDAEALIGTVRDAFLRRDFSDIECGLVDTAAEGESEASAESMLQTIYDTIYVEPLNAMYDKQTGGATESEQGVSFDMEDALRRWNEASFGEEVYIPFIFTDPEIDADALMERLFSDLLAEKSTSLAGSSSNRITNVTLAAQALDGTVVNPGETFDYNSCLGERTTARGYKEAGAYSGGKHVTNVGGGICQDSSTLYYCAIYANLRITVRDCHYFVVSYLPWGMDATVSWGGPDFRFVNSRDYPIRIKAWVSNGSLTVQLWGTDVDGSYVRVTSETWEDDEFYYAQTYRTVYAADGTQLSSGREAYSRYHKYEAGEETPPPAEDTPKPTPETEQTPEPSPTPTAAPSTPETAAPTTPPTTAPTTPPTEAPTTAPTEAPTTAPTEAPTAAPEESPSETDDGGGGDDGGE